MIIQPNDTVLIFISYLVVSLLCVVFVFKKLYFTQLT